VAAHRDTTHGGRVVIEFRPGALVRAVRTEHEIDASPSELYAVLTDLPSYGSWNPFTPGARSTLEPGATIELDVVLNGKLHHRVESVIAVEPNHKLAWGMRMAGGLLLRSQRTQTLVPISERRTRYVSEQSFEGPLAPLVHLLFAKTIESGFRAVGDALTKRFAAR
jgi:hypothetical protein